MSILEIMSNSKDKKIEREKNNIFSKMFSHHSSTSFSTISVHFQFQFNSRLEIYYNKLTHASKNIVPAQLNLTKVGSDKVIGWSPNRRNVEKINW